MEIIIKMIMYSSISEMAEHKAVVWIVSVPITSIKGWLAVELAFMTHNGAFTHWLFSI